MLLIKSILLKIILSYPKKTKVLEVGAGSGYFSYHLEKLYSLLATDVNKEILLLNPVKNKLVCNANKLPFEDNSFSVVVAFDVLHHVDNPKRVIKELKRVSRKYLILTEPNADNIFQKIFTIFFPREWGTFRFTTKYFRDLIKKNHLKILKFRHIGRLISPNTPLPLFLLKKLPYSSFTQLNLSNIAICQKT